jgi:F-type H+-transporting ATPase subunit b
MNSWTLLFQAINFLVLAAVLRRFLFRPVTAAIAKRQRDIEAASERAERSKRAADESRAGYEEERRKLEVEVENARAQLTAELAQEREASAQRARLEAAALIGAARADIDREREDAAVQTVDAAAALGLKLATRLLEQVAGSAVAEALLENVCRQIEGLPGDRLRALQAEIDGGSTPIEVATAPALGADAHSRWAKRIGDDLGGVAPVRFVSDAALLAGAELRLPRTKISVCWRDGLDAARRELARHADGH